MTVLMFRGRQLGRLMRAEGLAGILKRARTRLARQLAPAGSAVLPIGDAEFEAEANMSAAGWALPSPVAWREGESLSIAWVTDPPAPGSGGHTTMFRLIRALRAAGHSSTLYLVDRHGWDVPQHLARIRQGWPDVEIEVRDFRDGVADCHALFATGWESAWTVLRTDALGLRCYLVQDYEPLFHAAGSHSLLAEATYNFGFKGVTAGKWLPSVLEERFGMEAVGFDFGCDRDRYFLKERRGVRRAVSYYCRPTSPRRAHELAVAALRLFSRRNPDVPIHLYGERVQDLGFEAMQHGVLSPEQLNDLYNKCAAGLVLSATNVSLVPHEMLAAGCIPVVNDADHNRLVLDNDQVKYAPATPYHLAAALEDVVRRSSEDEQDQVTRAAASVSGRTWDAVGEEFVSIVTQLVANARADQASWGGPSEA